MSARRLAAAVLHAGMLKENASTSPGWLRRQSRLSDEALVARLRDLYPAIIIEDRSLPVQGRAGTYMTGRLVGLLRTAEALANKVSPQGVIHARHVVAAILLHARHDDNNLRRFLSGCQIDALDSLNLLEGEVGAWGDNAERWASFIDDALSRPEGGPPGTGDDEADVEDPDGRGADPGSVPKYAVDSADGEDLVGIRPEVEAFAALAAAWSVEPPLSIGLFGEWGSGKTFFMRQMQHRVRKIAEKARESGVGQKEFGFYKNIVQVEFNAWHYADCNLWASLVEHIFQNLRMFDEDDEALLNERRARLFKEMQVKLKESEAVEAKKASLQDDLRVAEERARAARAEAQLKEAQKAEVGQRLVAEALRAQVPRVKEEVRAALAGLGVSGQQLDTAAEVQGAIRKGLEKRTQAWAAIKSWRTNKRRWAVLALVAGAALVVPAAALALSWLGGLEWTQRAAATVGGILAVVSAGVTAVLKIVRPAVTKLREAQAAFDSAVAEAQRRRDQEVAKLDTAAEEARAEAARNDATAAEVKRDIRRIEQAIDALTPARMIESFIHERASAEDYRKHLGLTAVIRRDFEKLSRMFAQQRLVEKDGKDGIGLAGRNDPGVVNRIILYVDDLDRCPPKDVVEVLRIIHLLLAFPLFVVVVAVDARWMKRSLRDRFTLMLGGTPGPADADFDPQATPDDYLEKIFQVPYWIRSMEDEDCRSLIRGLVPPSPAGNSATGGSTPSDSPVKESQPRDQPLNPAGGPPGEAPRRGSVAPRRSFEPNATKWSEVVPNPPSLEIGAAELSYMETLGPVIGRSPRAVKRFINCYRLIKTTDAPLLRGRTPGYPVVMLMLAISTGLPTLAPKIMESLWTTSNQSMVEWLSELRTRITATETLNFIIQQFGSLAAHHEVTLETLRAVAERVERYSFRPVLRRSPS